MEKEREVAISLLDDFGGYLNKKKITIPSEDRTGSIGESRIYGAEYYELEDALTDILKNSSIISVAGSVMDEFKGMLNHAGIKKPKGVSKLRHSVLDTLKRES